MCQQVIDPACIPSLPFLHRLVGHYANQYTGEATHRSTLQSGRSPRAHQQTYSIRPQRYRSSDITSRIVTRSSCRAPLMSVIDASTAGYIPRQVGTMGQCTGSSLSGRPEVRTIALILVPKSRPPRRSCQGMPLQVTFLAQWASIDIVIAPRQSCCNLRVPSSGSSSRPS